MKKSLSRSFVKTHCELKNFFVPYPRWRMLNHGKLNKGMKDFKGACNTQSVSATFGP